MLPLFSVNVQIYHFSPLVVYSIKISQFSPCENLAEQERKFLKMLWTTFYLWKTIALQNQQFYLFVAIISVQKFTICLEWWNFWFSKTLFPVNSYLLFLHLQLGGEQFCLRWLTSLHIVVFSFVEFLRVCFSTQNWTRILTSLDTKSFDWLRKKAWFLLKKFN